MPKHMQYQNDSMAICVYTYMQKIVEDQSILPIMDFALHLAETHIVKIKNYFTQEKFPIPHGYTADDVDLTAPRLFSDELCLSYTYIMAVNGLAGYTAALTTNMRRDIRDYFTQCQNETMELFNKSPFSDRLMVYHKLLFGSTTIGIYGTALGSVQRMDLAAHYTRLIAEMGQYSEDGYKIMLTNKWAEQPPMTDDRQALANQR